MQTKFSNKSYFRIIYVSLTFTYFAKTKIFKYFLKKDYWRDNTNIETYERGKKQFVDLIRTQATTWQFRDINKFSALDFFKQKILNKNY